MTAPKRIRFFTGHPEVGKTTTLVKTTRLLRNHGLLVGGFISPEIRVVGDRVGFELRDLLTERTGTLAHMNQRIGPRVGRYKVNLADLDTVGVEAIDSAIASTNVIAIDEIGPTELFSDNFKSAVYKALQSRKA